MGPVVAVAGTTGVQSRVGDAAGPEKAQRAFTPLNFTAETLTKFSPKIRIVAPRGPRAWVENPLTRGPPPVTL